MYAFRRLSREPQARLQFPSVFMHGLDWSGSNLYISRETNFRRTCFSCTSAFLGGINPGHASSAKSWKFYPCSSCIAAPVLNARQVSLQKCCDLCSEWTATIEMNRVDQATTWAMQQTYSQSQGKIRMDVHSKGANRVLLQDIANNDFWIITQPNSTYPNGAF